MNSNEIRERFINFFKNRGHTVIPSASLITPDEKGIINPTLFNTAGMQPLIPYLLGKQHPGGTRLVDIQKCIRTIDIDDIGDKTHATFFEMLGNWSLGDYFKKEAITWSYEFLTDPKVGLGLDKERLYVTVFAGDLNTERDDEAANIWKSVGVREDRIYYKDAASNWWPAVKGKDGWTGPTGPCSEMFYDVTKDGLGNLTSAEFEKVDSEQKVVEIWNDVFMEFEKVDGKIVSKLAKKNVDTGAGFERLAMVMQNVDNIYDTDLLKPIMDNIKTLSLNWNIRSARIVADHIKASVHMIADGVMPSNSDRGYVLRKLIRRAVRHSDLLKMDQNISLVNIVSEIQKIYAQIYANTVGADDGQSIKNIISAEEFKFRETLAHGLKEFEKISNKDITASEAFSLFSSYGFPLELTIELSKEKGINVDTIGFDMEFKKHQELSRSGAELKFKGGLADSSDPTIVRYHTATHLLHQALHDVLGEGICQKGSNITTERLRFDFSFDAKMTDEQKKKVEDLVNQKIFEGLPVNKIIMPIEEAKKTGARHFFAEKYGDDVSIYYIGADLKTAYSKEFCGGPHVNNTNELSGSDGKLKFKIQKEEAIAQGIRRIKAVLV